MFQLISRLNDLMTVHLRSDGDNFSAESLRHLKIGLPNCARARAQLNLGMRNGIITFDDLLDTGLCLGILVWGDQARAKVSFVGP
jgi:hypothetical protein